jgi:hypothetical protein
VSGISSPGLLPGGVAGDTPVWTGGGWAAYREEMADRGFLAWSGPPWGANTAVPISQTEIVTKIPLPYNISVTSIICAISAVGVTLTAGQSLLTLYQQDGTKLGSTVDQAAAWAAAVGAYQLPVTGGPFNLTGGPGLYCWVGLLCNGTTPATFRMLTPNPAFAAMSGAAGGQLSGAALRAGRIGTAITAPASFTPSALSSSNAGAAWYGLS